jgi:hypothetical protein
MRDPVAPIPSPFAASKTARGFWQATARPPPPPARHGRGEAPDYDPTALLPMRGDVRGIDRRTRSRVAGDASTESATGCAITAARHVGVHAFFGLQTPEGWALVRSLCMSPTGVLVRLFDPRDPDLDIDEVRVGRSIFRQLAPMLDRHATAASASGSDARVGSPLAAVGGCVLAPRVVADLSGWANGRSARRSSGQRRPIHVTLVLATRARGAGGRAEGAIARIPGEIVPLNDPRADLLGVALGPDSLAWFASAVADLVHDQRRATLRWR